MGTGGCWRDTAAGGEPVPIPGEVSQSWSLHRYDRNKLTLKDIRNCQYVACMNPTAGSFTIDPRLQVRRAGQGSACHSHSPGTRGWNEAGDPAGPAGCGAKCPRPFVPLCAAPLLRAGCVLPQPGGSAHRVRHHPEAAPGPPRHAHAAAEDAAPAGGSSAG